MKLNDYINSFPRTERTSVRERIANACKVGESCIKHYANGTRSIPAKHFKTIIAQCPGVLVDDLLEEHDSDAA